MTSFTAGSSASWRLVAVGYVDPTRLLPDPTDHEGDIVEVRADGTGYDLVRPLQPDDIIPHVGRIKAMPTAADPDLVFLTESYSEGARSDATLTVGFDGALSGYSDVQTGLGFGLFDAASPIARLFGIGTASSYNVETLSSFSKSWVNDVASIWIAGDTYTLGVAFREGSLWSRRIQGFPSGLSAATLSVNVRMLDNDWYFTTGIGNVYGQGLYEKIDLDDDGLLYDALTSLGFVHVDGVGPPTQPPTRPVQGYGNDLGQLWISGGTFAYHTVDPTGSESAFTHALYVSDPVTRTQIFDEAGDGGFSWIIAGGVTGFVQWQGAGNYVENLLWREVWNYIAEHVYGPGSGANHQTAVRYRDHAFFAGGFHTLTPALRVIDIFLGGDPFAPDTYFWGKNVVSPADGLRVVDTLVPGDVERSDNFFWNGPFQTLRDVQDYVEDHHYGMIKDVLVAGANVTITADDADQTLTIAAGGGGGGGADGVVETATMMVTGQALLLTLGLTVGPDVTATVMLPTAPPGPTPPSPPVRERILDGALTNNSPTMFTLTEPLEAASLYRIKFVNDSSPADATFNVEFFFGMDILEKNTKATSPTSGVDGFRFSGANPGAGLTASQPSVGNIWHISATELWISNSRGGNVTLTIDKVTF